MPLISAKDNNNGLKAFVAANGKKIFSGDCLTLNNDGSGTGIAYYQPTDFLLDSHVTALLPRCEMSREVMLFVARCIRMQRERYGFGYSLTNTRLNLLRVMLPVTDDGTPDFDYMEAYVAAHEEKILQSYCEFVDKLSISGGGMTPPLREKLWREFNLASVFSIRATSSGIDKNKLVTGAGTFPYVTRTDRNNGIQNFICEQPNYNRDSGNCIIVGLDTQTAFYQPTAFYTGQNIQILTNYRLNADNAKFLLPLLKNMLSIFSWGGNGATLTRLRRSKILLPVTDGGVPDFDYMEAYVRKITAAQYRKYLKYAFDKAAQ